MCVSWCVHVFVCKLTDSDADQRERATGMKSEEFQGNDGQRNESNVTGSMQTLSPSAEEHRRWVAGATLPREKSHVLSVSGAWVAGTVCLSL